MVQKYHSPIRVYKYPFELVMAAYERRFPSCDMIPVFEGSEIISEERSEDGAEIIIVRRCKLNVDAPYLLKKIAGVDYFYCLQKNSLDYRSRTLKITAWNESFSNRIIIEEYCTYFVHPENSDWTCFEQSASLEVKSFFGFENAVEKLSAKHYAASIKKGKEVIEHFIEELKSEGVTFIEPFKGPIESNGKLEEEEEDKENDNLTNNKQQELSENNKSPNAKLQSNDTSIDEKTSNSFDKQLSVDEKSKDNKTSKDEKKKLSPNKANNTSTPPPPPPQSNQTTPPVNQLTTQQKRDLMKKQQTSFSTESTFPSTNANTKLEADYIQKCIGEMSPYQESCLVQLKKRIIETHYNQGNQPTQTNMSLKKKIPSDQTLMRFLKANDYNLEKAREMLCSSLVWRKVHQVDKILSSYNFPDVVQKYYPGCWLNIHDKDGRPIYMLMVGLLDLKGFVRSIGQEGLVKLTLHICEQGLKKAEEATKKFGKPISTWTLLLDLEGLNMRHLWRPGIKAVLHIIEMVEANYPETLGRVIMTRAPRIFPVLFTILATFINENTSKKFVFLGDQQDLKILEQFIDKKDIPKFLGGKLDNPPQLIIGGLIPKSHYVSEEKANELNMLDNTMYTNISLTKPGQTHEVLYEIKDSQSVICWDFDILKQNVIFNFYRLNSNLQQHQIVNKVNSDTNYIKEEKSHSKDNLNNNNLVKKLSKENVNDDKKKQQSSSSQESLNEEQLTITEKQLQNRLSGDASCGLIIPKNWQLNKDFQQIEPELLCREGDSIQGSHITSKPGKYVLQWKYLEPDANHHHSFSSHKAKIMYYIEVIKSKTFKGSMTSLSSLHSSHSTNSTSNQLINQTTNGSNVSCVV